MTNILHGGDLAAAEAEFGPCPREFTSGWLDLSTGINPCPYPSVDMSPASLHRLPDQSGLAGLLTVACGYYCVPETAAIAAAPGTQSLLQLLPGSVGGRTVTVLSPTYGEHASLWRDCGRDVLEVTAIDQMADSNISVIVNPNNPDGRVIEPSQILDLSRLLSAKGGLLIVDEAFADLDPAHSVADEAGIEGLLVLRSFGKFFGLAGLRLGFALGARPLIGAIASRLGPWAVSGPAIEIGARALSDSGWISETRDNLARLRHRLDEVLMGRGLDIIGGTDLYRLVVDGDATSVYRRLGAKGVLVRRFPDFPNRLRFGLPGDDEGFRRLDQALGG